jgi:LemA protein
VGYVIAGAVIVVLVVAFIGIYNGLVRLRNRADNAWAQVDVQLKRRYDLIPNLVETVKGYAAHEQSTFEQVVEARNRAVAAGTVEEQAQAENFLTGALRQLFALAESIYNDSVLSFNNRVQVVPSNMVAALTGFSVKDFFEAPDEAEQTPEVSF